MTRAIVTSPPPAAAPGTRGFSDDFAPPAAEADDYADKVLKLIPGEVITVYLSMMAILGNSAPPNPALVPWLVFAFGVFATWFYLRVPLKVTNRRQILVTVGAFCVWAFTLGPPFDDLAWYKGTYAGLLLAAYTFIAPHIPMAPKSS